MPLFGRPDGKLARDVPPVRRVMPYIMRGRNESSVSFEQKIRASKIQAFLDDVRARTGLRAAMIHLLIWGFAKVVAERPRLNRFVAGGRIYERDGIWVSFSAKKAKVDGAPIVVIKKKIDPSWSFEQLVETIESGIGEGRSDKLSATDKELGLLFRLPAILVWALTRIQVMLDYFGLLPASFYRNDPLYASVLIANLGSVHLESAFHHLYEYGNIPIFMAAGRVQDEVVVGPERTPVVEPVLTVRYTFDERIEDGLYCARALEMFRALLEDPANASRPEGGDPKAGVC